MTPLTAETVRTQSRLNLRQEPSTASAQVALLPEGADLEVISRRGLWIRVDSAAGEGWVHSEYVISTDLLDEAPAEQRLRDAELAREVALLRVERLEKELAELHREGPADAAELRAELAGRDRRIEQLEADLAAALASEADPSPTDELAEAIAAREDLERRLAEVEAKLEASEAALAAAEAGPDAESLGVERDRLAERVVALVVERDAAVARARGLEAELEEARRLAAERQTEAGVLSEQAETIRSLETRLAESSEQAATDRATWQERLAVAEAEASRQSERNLDLEAELERLNEQVGSLEGAQASAAEVERLRALLAAEEASREELERERTELLAELERAAASAVGTEGLSETLVAEIAAREAVERERERLRGELAQAIAEREDSAARSAEIEAEAQRLARALLELQAWSEEAEQVVERLNAENLELEGQLAELRSRRQRRGEPPDGDPPAEVEARATAAEQRVTRLEAELAAARETLEAVRDAAERDRRQAVAATREIERLRQQLELASQRDEGEEVARAAALRQLEAAAAEASTWRQRAEAATRQLEASRRESMKLGAVATVEQWADAWSSRDLNRYLTFYDTSFEPPDGLDRATWEAQRRRELGDSEFIEIDLRGFEVRSLGDARVAVSFDLAYRADTAIERERKLLELVRRDGGWRITRETMP